MDLRPVSLNLSFNSFENCWDSSAEKDSLVVCLLFLFCRVIDSWLTLDFNWYKGYSYCRIGRMCSEAYHAMSSCVFPQAEFEDFRERVIRLLLVRILSFMKWDGEWRLRFWNYRTISWFDPSIEIDGSLSQCWWHWIVVWWSHARICVSLT